MHRVPATSPSDKPPCFGKHPSIVFGGCSTCSKRTACFRKFSTPGVTVLPIAILRVNISPAGDRRATAALLHGFDNELWGAMRTLATKHGLRLSTRAKHWYRARARDKNKNTVFYILRLDRRRVLIHFSRVDVETAISVGCRRAFNRGSNKVMSRLDLPGSTDNLMAVMVKKLDKLLAMSYLAGTFVPGKSRASTP